MLPTKIITGVPLLCSLASLVVAISQPPAILSRSSSCQISHIYKGGDLLAMDLAYEPVMIAQLQYWSGRSQTPGLTADADNINKSFFNCTGNLQLDLVYWCACGIVDDLDSATGMKTGEKCFLPCSASRSAGSEAANIGAPMTVAAVGTVAVLFAIGLI